MHVVNSIPKIKNSYAKSTGLGLKNIKQRLELIYGSKYSLTIQNIADNFTINLQLPLATMADATQRTAAITYK